MTPEPTAEAHADALVVLSTAPDAATAERLARALVDEQLAACVTSVPGVTSTYRWQGVVEQSQEVLLVIKTRAALLATLTARILELHPYDVPEVIALPVVGGAERYLAWIGQSVRTAP